MSLPTVHLDFESFSEVDLKTAGTCRYAEDPSTELICAAYAIGDEEPHLWKAGDPPPRRLFRAIDRGCHVHAWNVEMEIPDWEEICVKRMGWPSVPFDQWRDTSAPALMLALPAALEDCGAALGLDVQKDRRGKHLVHKLCKPRKPSKFNPATRWTPETAPQDFADFYEYNLQDVRAERAIYRALPLKELPLFELEMWQATVRMNLRGWTVDAESVDRMLVLLAEHKTRATDELQELTHGLITTGGQIEKIKAWLRAQHVHLPNLQEKTVSDALVQKKNIPERARRLLEIRRELAKASTAKYQAMLTRRCRDGTVKNNILFHGAKTGRDAHRGMQIGNFPRAAISKTEEGVERAVQVLHSENPLRTVELVYGSVPHYASRLLRSVLTAEAGHDLYAADFSSVENRITVWYAGCDYGIDLFRRGLDEYKAFAVRFYDGTGGRPRVTYETVTDHQRQHCKQMVLGFCFQMGEKAYVAQALRYGQVVELKAAAKMKAVYRDTYPEVCDLWAGLNRAAIRTVRKKAPHSYGRIGFEVSDDFLYMRLASGRRLAYYKPLVEMKMAPWGQKKPTVTHMGVGKTKQWERLKVTPGRFTENAVQATARDAMMWGARNTGRAGYALVGRVHDELISQMRERVGHLGEYIRLMVDTPWWLDGIPIVATGWTGKRYRK